MAKKTTRENWMIIGGGILSFIALQYMISWLMYIGIALVFGGVGYVFWHYRENWPNIRKNFWPKIIKK